MTYGLQVFNSSGNLEIDISSRLSRYIGSVTFQTAEFQFKTDPPVPQNLNFTGISNDGSWFVGNVPGSIGVEIHTGYITVYSTYLSYIEGYYDPSLRLVTLDIFRF